VTQKKQDPETENISTEEMEEATVLKGKGGVWKNSDRPLRTMLKTRKKKLIVSNQGSLNYPFGGGIKLDANV